jgi:basic membrane lipoprotein Med (substrate-binding protein (PBP1-ABC) superfamily)
VLDGKFAGGTDSVFSIKNDGVALGKVSSKVPKKYVTEVRKISAQIANGTIANIPTEVASS